MERLPQGRWPQEQAGGAASHRDCLEESDELRVEPGDAHYAQLARAIEMEIIPRLMLAHRPLPRLLADTPFVQVAIGQDEVLHFAKLVLSPDEDMSLTYIAGLRSRGVTIESVYIDLLAPAARHFGYLWEEDLCDFSDVTVGLGRLQRVLRNLSPSFGCAVEHPAQGRRVLLLPSPGEQHTFGLVMVSEFFRHAGWDVSGGAWMTGTDAPAMVGTEWFDVLGFSMAVEAHLQPLADCIRAARDSACNRGLAIMVGGPMFSAHPEYVAQVGADGMATDGREAPALAEKLIVERGGH